MYFLISHKYTCYISYVYYSTYLLNESQNFEKKLKIKLYKLFCPKIYNITCHDTHNIPL